MSVDVKVLEFIRDDYATGNLEEGKTNTRLLARAVLDQELRLRLLERHFNQHDRREPQQAQVVGKQLRYPDGGIGLSEEGRRYMEEGP